MKQALSIGDLLWIVMMVLSISLSARVGDSRRLWNKLGTQLGLLIKERSARKSDLLYGSSNLFLKVDEFC